MQSSDNEDIDTSYNYNYDTCVGNSAKLTGISQMQKSSIGDEFDYNVVMDGNIAVNYKS